MPAVLHLDTCNDDIVRAGWPLKFNEEGGFVYRNDFNALAFVVDIGTGLSLSAIGGWFTKVKK